MGTALGRKIPAFLWRSVDEVSKSIDQSKVFKDKGIIQSMGYLRFQFETKSDDRIDAAAKDIVGSETDERKKAYLLYRWVGKNIKYDWNKYNDINAGTAGNDKFGAVNTFNTGKGVCEDYSDLYTAMARAAGLKVRIIVGQGFNGINWEGHAWNEVYINSENRWIPLDTTWAGSGNYFDSKGFYETHIFEGVAGEW
jgi:transglutaminase-like putative cysteine protease